MSFAHSSVTHFIEVEARPKRRGLIQFCVAASWFDESDQLRTDPADGALTDQRDEPVSCGVMDVK
jgi:hypothetical protein